MTIYLCISFFYTLNEDKHIKRPLEVKRFYKSIFYCRDEKEKKIEIVEVWCQYFHLRLETMEPSKQIWQCRRPKSCIPYFKNIVMEGTDPESVRPIPTLEQHITWEYEYGELFLLFFFCCIMVRFMINCDFRFACFGVRNLFSKDYSSSVITLQKCRRRVREILKNNYNQQRRALQM